MSAQKTDYKAEVFKARNLIFLLFLVLLVAACTLQVQAPTSKTAPQPAGRTDENSHTPVILKIVERTDKKDGQTIISEDITFIDAGGDATTVVDETVWANQRVTTSNVKINVSAAVQKSGTTVTDDWGCGPDLLRVVETRILDRAGNLSDPVQITISCPRSQLPPLLPFMIAAAVTGLGLLLGAWLVFGKRPSERTSVFQSLLLLFTLLFPLYFAYMVLHEGGHALTSLTHGATVELLYVHPFSFAGYNMLPFDWDSALFHAGGVLVALPVSLIISLPFWKRRSISNLPLVMFFPWVAILQGLRMLTVGGDFSTIVYLTGIPFILFIIVGFLVVSVGVCLLLSLFPLFDLPPGDRKSLFVIPAAIFLWNVLGILVVYFFVPGSPADVQYRLTLEIFNSTLYFLVAGPIIGVILALLYLKLYPRFPAWLRTETVHLTWKDLRIPAFLTVISVFLGLLII